MTGSALLLAASRLDAAVLVGYLALSFAAGLLASRWLRGSGEGEEAYYLGSRRIPAWVNGVSYAATAVNADVAPMYCGLALVIGLPTAWYYLSRFAFAWAIVALLFAVRWRQLGVRTGPEFYTLRFGGRAATFVRVYTALFSVAVNMVPWLGAGLLGTHKILAPTFGVESKAVTLACILPLLVTYVWVSGFAGVVVTDVLQALVILSSSVVLLVSVLAVAGGPTALAATIRDVHPIDQGEILSITPVWGHDILSPLAVLLWFIVPTVGRGGNVDLDGQRMFSCRTPREAALAPLWAAAALFLMLLLITLPTLGLLAENPLLYHASPTEREHAYGMLLERYLPAGLLGLALAALLASVMSTIDSHLNYGAQTLVNDVLRPIFPRASLLDPQSPRSVWVGRLLMLVILACGIAVMYAAGSLFRIATVVAGMFAASAGFFWAQWWWWRVNLPAWAAAMIGGPIVYFSLGACLPRWTWWAEQVAVSPGNADLMAMVQALLAMTLTTALWIVTTLVTRPESEATLRAFYLRAQPPGWWGPVSRRLVEEGAAPAPQRGLLFGGLATAAVAAIGLSLPVLCLGQLMVARYEQAAVLATGAIVAGLALRRLAPWHLDRMEAHFTPVSEHS
jgi:Na+/proline symporter